MAALVSSAAIWLTTETAAALSSVGFTVTPGLVGSIYTTVEAGLYVAGSVGLNELAGALQSSPSPAQQKANVRQAIGPRTRCYGEVKIGGTYAFLDDRQSYLYQVIMINSGEIDSFVSHWLGDAEVTLDGSGNVTVPANYVSGGTKFVTIDTVLGTDTQASFAKLIAAFPDEWTSAHQLKGIACALITMLSPKAADFSKIYPSGLPPYNAVIHASKLWDPRDPSQSPDDPSTWKYE